jgi:hypothetical protein
MTRNQKYERLLRRLRQRIFDFDDTDPREAQCFRLILRCKVILAPLYRAQAARAEYIQSERLLSMWA